MKLTEQQLSQLFQDSTQSNQCDVEIGDCLTGGINEVRLNNAEAIVDDRIAAQSFAMASHFKTWSDEVAHDITEAQSQQSRSSRLLGFVKNILPQSPKTITAMAVVFSLTAVVFLSSQQFISHTDQSTHLANQDVINSLPFEGTAEKPSDRLSRGGFDSPAEPDQLFNNNFS